MFHNGCVDSHTPHGGRVQDFMVTNEFRWMSQVRVVQPSSPMKRADAAKMRNTTPPTKVTETTEECCEPKQCESIKRRCLYCTLNGYYSFKMELSSTRIICVHIRFRYFFYHKISSSVIMHPWGQFLNSWLAFYFIGVGGNFGGQNIHSFILMLITTFLRKIMLLINVYSGFNLISIYIILGAKV